MNRKIVVSFILFILFIASVKADDEVSTNKVTVSKSSEYVTTVSSFNRVEIDYIDEADDSFIKGAKLKITDKNDNVVVDWVSEDETVVIEGLDVGTYYLSEVKPKEGYEKATDKIMFRVNDEAVLLEFSTNKIVEEPKILTSNLLLIIYFSMFDVALGIGMFIYARKAKN